MVNACKPVDENHTAYGSIPATIAGISLPKPPNRESKIRNRGRVDKHPRPVLVLKPFRETFIVIAVSTRSNASGAELCCV